MVEFKCVQPMQCLFLGRQRRRITRESGRWRHCGRYSRSTTRSQGKGAGGGEAGGGHGGQGGQDNQGRQGRQSGHCGQIAQEIEMMEKDDYQAYLQNGESSAVSAMRCLQLF